MHFQAFCCQEIDILSLVPSAEQTCDTNALVRLLSYSTLFIRTDSFPYRISRLVSNVKIFYNKLFNMFAIKTNEDIKFCDKFCKALSIFYWKEAHKIFNFDILTAKCHELVKLEFPFEASLNRALICDEIPGAFPEIREFCFFCIQKSFTLMLNK